MYKTLKSKNKEKNKEKLTKKKIPNLQSMMDGGNTNENFIEILKRLEFYNRKYENNGFFKAKIYREAIKKISELNEDIKDEKKLDELGIGKAVKDKYNEYLKTGKVKNLEDLKEKYNNDYENNIENEEIKKTFLKIHGIGEKLADKLIELNIK